MAEHGMVQLGMVGQGWLSAIIVRSLPWSGQVWGVCPAPRALLWLEYTPYNTMEYTPYHRVHTIQYHHTTSYTRHTAQYFSMPYNIGHHTMLQHIMPHCTQTYPCPMGPDAFFSQIPYNTAQYDGKRTNTEIYYCWFLKEGDIVTQYATYHTKESHVVVRRKMGSLRTRVSSDRRSLDME